MPSLPSPQALLIAFLGLSYLLLFVLPRHENHYVHPYPLNTTHSFTIHIPETPFSDLYVPPSSRAFLPPSFYSRDRHGAIEIFKKDNHVVCRVYRMCRLRNGAIHLPVWMKLHSHLLRKECHIKRIIFSRVTSLRIPFWMKQYDLIETTFSDDQLPSISMNSLSSFFVGTKSTQSLFDSNATGRIERTCISPWTHSKRQLSRICDSKPEGRVSYPAIIFDQDNFKNTRELIDPITNSFYDVLGATVTILNIPMAKMGARTCFRSFITTSSVRTIQRSGRHLSMYNRDGDTDMDDTMSVLGDVFVRIGTQLKGNAEHISNTKNKIEENGQMIEPTTQRSIRPRTKFKREVGSEKRHSVMRFREDNSIVLDRRNGLSRRVLAQTSKSNGSFPEKTVNDTLAGTPTGRVDSTRTRVALSETLANEKFKGRTGNVTRRHQTLNATATEAKLTDTPETIAVGATATPNTSNRTKYKRSYQSIANESLRNIQLETKDEGAVENADRGGNYLPTFQFLLDHPPE